LASRVDGTRTPSPLFRVQSKREHACIRMTNHVEPFLTARSRPGLRKAIRSHTRLHIHRRPTRLRATPSQSLHRLAAQGLR
jgi:hypothetical protein